LPIFEQQLLVNKPQWMSQTVSAQIHVPNKSDSSGEASKDDSTALGALRAEGRLENHIDAADSRMSHVSEQH